MVGHRAPVVEALKECGHKLYLWDEQLPLKRYQSYYEEIIISSSFNECPKILSEEFRGNWKSEIIPDHAIATKESSVTPAAVAREIFDIKGIKVPKALTFRDKFLMKEKVKKYGIRLTDYLRLNQKSKPCDLLKTLGRPLVVKERDSSGSRGLYIGSDQDEIKELCQKMKMAERFIDAREMSIESFVVDGEVLFMNFTEYFKKGSINIVPASLPTDEEELIKKFVHRVLEIMEVKNSMTHLEIYLPDDWKTNGPIFGEIAVRPPGGYIMDLIGISYGINAWELFTKIELRELEDESKQKLKELKAQQVSAAIICHPGEGTLENIDGKEEVEKLQSVVEFTLRVSPGDIISKRLGLGESVGHLILKSHSRSDLISDINLVNGHLKFRLAP